MLDELDRLMLWKLDEAIADAFPNARRPASRGPMTADAREFLAITEAVRAAVVDAVAGGCPTEIAVTRAVAAIIAGPAEGVPAERPSDRNRRQNGAAIAQMAELKRQGKSRQAASIVARRLALDPADPAEIWALAQRFRRLRRTQK